jgi:hypothetical protein
MGENREEREYSWREMLPKPPSDGGNRDISWKKAYFSP